MNQMGSTQLQRLWEEARITRNVTLMARTSWLALVKPSEGLFISREAWCVWKRLKRNESRGAVQQSRRSPGLKFGENKSKAEWAWWKKRVSSRVIKFEQRTEVRSISNCSKERKIMERVTNDQKCR